MTEPIGDFKVVSLSVITSGEVSGGYGEGDQVELLYGGQTHYDEILCGLRFQVSPFAFFQVNTKVFEKMLDVIKEFAGIDDQTTLLDICCGTGAIGLCLAERAKKVIGVELINEAVVNARQNVVLNQDRL
jgi:tRNA/tmRNA/rRNA uracil-C5-methylase (TrmA/RlmC/RlmD family)